MARRNKKEASGSLGEVRKELGKIQVEVRVLAGLTITLIALSFSFESANATAMTLIYLLGISLIMWAFVRK